jgi:ParB-like nuclease domain
LRLALNMFRTDLATFLLLAAHVEPAPVIHYSPTENVEHIDVGLLDTARQEIDLAAYVLTEMKRRRGWHAAQETEREAEMTINKGLAYLDVVALRVRKDARPLVEENVEGLVASIKELGIISPLRVRAHSGGAWEWEILAGVHRFEAAKRLGLEKIPCIIQPDSDLQAELIMIDENITRADLNASQEAVAMRRRKEIYETLHPETKATYNGGGFRGNRHTGKLVGDNLSFTSATTTATGKYRRSIERAVARAEALGDDLDDIAGTSLDKGVEIDALAKMPPAERKPLIARAKTGENVSAKAVLAKTKAEGAIMAANLPAAPKAARSETQDDAELRDLARGLAGKYSAEELRRLWNYVRDELQGQRAA